MTTYTIYLRSVYIYYRTLQTDLVGGVLLGILHVYKSCMDRYISQTMSLQYMFDLWYVTGLLLWKNSKQVGITLSKDNVLVLCIAILETRPYIQGPVSTKQVWLSTELGHYIITDKVDKISDL